MGGREMPLKRFIRALETLIERYGEDVSLAHALEREKHPKGGRPLAPLKGAEETYMLVELAVDAGHDVRSSCRMIDKLFEIDLGEDWVRNRYRTGKKNFAPILKGHRTEILGYYAAKFPAWMKHLQDHPGNGKRVKTPRG